MDYRNRHLLRRGPRLGAEPMRAEDLPPDLQRRLVQNQLSPQEESIDYRTMSAVESIASIQSLTRGLYGRNITIGTTPSLVIRAERLRSYLFLNPAAGVGLTTDLEALPLQVFTGTNPITGNTQSDPIDVSTYREAHVFVNLTDTNSEATAVSIWAQAQDPVSGNWADAQGIISQETVVGTYYASIGTVGVTSDLAFRWRLSESPGPPTATFSIGVVLKDGLSRSSEQGVTNAIYLGVNGVTTETGFPLLEGQSQAFNMKDNLELFAIGKVAGLSLRVFEL